MKKTSLVLCLALTLGLPAVTSAQEPVRLRLGASAAEWALAPGGGAAVLTMVGPAGRERFEFPAGTSPSISLFEGNGQIRPDGFYRWEVVVAPAIAAKRDGSGDGQGLQGQIQSGTFTIRAGAFLSGTEVEPKPTLEAAPQAGSTGIVDRDGVPANDFLVSDDLVVTGSACVGFDCVNGESFGFDTIRLKENSTRIKFDDTSTSSFPDRDWQLTANDSASGGAEKFSIEDITSATVPFTVEGGAPTNGFFLDSTGRVGFRTSTPVLDLHVSTSNSPGLRLEQNSSGGFTAQTWDIVGNEANFFVRDVTGGSRLPFRIRPGAPTSSIDISASGKVGIGTASPSQKLHVRGSDGATQYLVEETSATSLNRVLMSLSNTGPVSTELVNTDANGTTWRINNLVGGLALNNINNAGNEAILSPTGTLTVLQTVVELSDRNRKNHIVPVDPQEILHRVGRLPVSTWSFIDSDPSERHLGPMAQDFAALFGLGTNDTTISARDMAGVSLAAIQALGQQIDSKDAEIESLKTRLASLEALVAKLAAPEPQ